MAGKKIKLIVETEDYHFTRLPAIRIGFLKNLLAIGLKFAGRPRRSEAGEKEGRDFQYSQILGALDRKDIDLLFKVLKEHEPFTLLEVEDAQNGVFIKIFTK